jgi:O-glycosyl hydrolase
MLRDTLDAAGLGSVLVTCCDAIGWSSQRTMTNQLRSANVLGDIGAITSHTYTSDVDNAIDAGGLPAWVTEAADLNSAWCTTWYSNGGLCEGMTWARRVAVGMVQGNLAAYIYWQGVEVNQFQASSYLVASDNNNVTPSGRLWAFAMWSRFVRPGAQRLSTQGSVSNVLWTAYKNTDGSVAAVFTNSGGSAQSVSLSVTGFQATAASAWLTDNSHSVSSHTVTLSSAGAAAVSVPARSVVTIRLTK